MEFCDLCENMLYMRTGEGKKLIKFCKHCNFTKENQENSFVKVSSTLYSEDELLYNQNINKYLRFDPTLRRINDEKTKCTNQDCQSNTKDVPQQVLYIKYHPQNMKYLYVCDHCGNIWRQDKNEKNDEYDN